MYNILYYNINDYNLNDNLFKRFFYTQNRETRKTIGSIMTGIR